MTVRFIRVPKTASQAIRATELFECEGHVPVSQIKRLPNDYTFAVSRNPYDRLVSAFCQGRISFNRKKTPYFNEFEPYKTFMDFVFDKKNPFLHGKVLGRNAEPYEYIKHPHYLPQTYWITIKGKLAVNKLLDFEFLDEDWIMLLRELKMPYVALQKVNKSNHSYWQDFYVKEIADVVYKHYQEDFDLLGYDKDSWRSLHGKSI
jgi:hypothetical protein